ncbi:hypothetical protein [Candidatus Binatus soli]|jgi:hypothetical protein|uniref:hypothetical protein n=1 Tax=Candidatus Binatus soli TaxID=1953413 RepID=UPI003D1185E7
MEVHRICELSPGTPVWVWIVRVGKGRWWPGSVLSIAARKPFPIINTRFECRSAGKNGLDGPAFVGISTTRMRYLELRDIGLKSEDRPNFVPSAIFAKPEENGVGLDGMQHVDTMTADARVPLRTAVKKSRARKKIKASKASNPRKDATAVAIE